MAEGNKIIVEQARVEVLRMREALAASEGRADARITLSMDQFGRLAEMLDRLAQAVDFWPDDELDDPRYWVPLGHFQRVQAAANHWESECGRLSEERVMQDLLRF